ncbi:cobaltochelatase subunit CobN [Sporosalibacterium faouarense]|uniref:cobaltochelatase subunit CobN n=1 Tax=Sporosalibacterium faouarense TaxID=516123 RepID=UPI00192B6A09|nr:cobaltochelatase subunit CobN [Sporosalibacterium faouarense]
MKITIATVSSSATNDISKTYKDFRLKYLDTMDLKLYYCAEDYREENINSIYDSIVESDLTILDLMGTPDNLLDTIEKACRKTKGFIVPYGGNNKEIHSLLKLGLITGNDMSGRNNRRSMRATNQAKIDKTNPKFKDMKNYKKINDYIKSGGAENITNLFLLLLRDYGNVKDIPKPEEPIKLTEMSIFDPKTSKEYKEFKEYAKNYGYDKDKPIVALLFYGHNYPTRTTDCIAEFEGKIKPFANVLPIAFPRSASRDIDKLKELLIVDGRKVDLILNFTSFRLGAGPMGGKPQEAIDMLEELDAPMLHPMIMSRRTEKEWLESPQGITSSEFLISVMLPELDGAIETIPIAAMETTGLDNELNIEFKSARLIEERADRIAHRVKNWLKLKGKINKEKKVAIICYNYPPGEDNIFGGAFLNTFQSIENILFALKKENYNTEALTKEELMDTFTAGKIVNSGRWASEKGNQHFIKYNSDKYVKELNSKSWKGEITEQWGHPPGEIMSDEDDFLIPGVALGNVFLGLQPTRGLHEDQDKVYHDKQLLPHHQYVAFYKWIKEEFKADVIIHVGTHGTLEFLNGKECGMSGGCMPDNLIGDIPHLYLYYCGNPAESMIAKRRSHGTIISYSSPPFVESELYGEYSNIEALISQYYESERLDTSRCKQIKEQIFTKAKEVNLSFDDMEDIEKELYRLKRSLIPKGLHIFGKGYSSEEAKDFAKFVMRYDRGEVKSLKRVAAEAKDLNYDDILEDNDIEKMELLEEEANKALESYFQAGNIKDEYRSTLEYGLRAGEYSKKTFELENLIKALNGSYIPARLAGDMIRNIDVLPSGFNLYQFDPRMVPSDVAIDRGRKIAQNTINQYVENHGIYPKSTAVVLWGLSTSRTQGETLGQILGYLGVRVKNRDNIYKPVYEVIPYEELGRPRIDVVINMCGFFRDMFPNMIDELNDIFKMISLLDESHDENYFKANTQMIYNKLISEGYEESEARELSYARLFGPGEGEYGTKVAKLIETKNWEDESSLGQRYVDSLKHVYTKNFRGRKAEDLLNTNLKSVDIVSQIRSNHEYEVTDLDHYYEYFGGLSKSVEMAKGQRAEVFITDTTNEVVETETVDKSIARGVRTRVLNPKWINEMLKHDYHGAQKIYDRFENMLGLAATTGKVDNWIFSEMHNKYVNDEEMKDRLKENNKWAYLSMVEILFECNKRGYWDATDDELKELQKTYLELEGDIEEYL